MKSELLEAGKVINTHGVRGEVKIESWCDTPEFLAQFKRLYIDGKAVSVLSARVYKNFVIASLDGVNDINAAMLLKGKVVSFLRADARLGEGRHFLSDIIGLEAIDYASGEVLGIVSEVLTPPAHPVYVVCGARELMIPAVEQFIIETDIDGGFLRVKLIDGM